MLKISVRSNFAGTKSRIDAVVLEDEHSNLMSVLSAVEAAIKVKLVNVDLGEVYPDIEVTLNGVDHNFLPDKSAAKVNDGDVLGISFITMGGG
ncbi:MAG: hypothetical protein V2B18_05850 [Pseudomonadota bacterium]